VNAPPAGGDRFATTRWSLVVSAGTRDGADGRAALAALCGAYWFPLYAFARRRGAGPDDAADLVQGFFADLLGRDSIRTASPERGRFRTFLLAAFRHFTSKERDRERAAKRGGGAPVLSLDLADGERRFLAEPTGGETPERLYERRFATTLLARVLAELEDDYAGDRAELFRVLRPWLVVDGDAPSHAEAAERLGMSEGAVKVALHRMRRRYRDRLRAAIAETVASPDDVDDEIRSLLASLAR
jgi:RNA polymerase sigma-70 factor (ECF subfamily)